MWQLSPERSCVTCRLGIAKLGDQASSQPATQTHTRITLSWWLLQPSGLYMLFWIVTDWISVCPQSPPAHGRGSDRPPPQTPAAASSSSAKGIAGSKGCLGCRGWGEGWGDRTLGFGQGPGDEAERWTLALAAVHVQDRATHSTHGVLGHSGTASARHRSVLL